MQSTSFVSEVEDLRCCVLLRAPPLVSMDAPLSARKASRGDSVFPEAEDNTSTYTSGADHNSLALRARSLGLERRAMELERERDRQRTRTMIWTQRSTAVHLRAIAALDPGSDDDDDDYYYYRPSGYVNYNGLTRGESDPLARTGSSALNWRQPSPEYLQGGASPSAAQLSSHLSSMSYESVSTVPEDEEEAAGGGGSDVDHHGPSLGAGGSTLNETLLAILKSTIGPGLLYMPKGFQEAGLLFAVPMMLLSLTLFSCGALRILEAWARHRRSAAKLMGLAG